MELNLHNRLDDDKLKELVEQVKLSEPFDYNATYIFTLKENDEILLTVVYRLEKVESTDKIFPRFIHIIVSEKLRRSKKAVMAIKLSEKYLAGMGFDTIFAYITTRNDMAILAQKFGYIGKDRYYFKSIGGDDVSRKTDNNRHY